MSKFGQNNTTLTNEQVLDIRKKRATGEYTYGRLSREYHVAYETIARICRGESRTKVPMPDMPYTPEQFKEMLLRAAAQASEAVPQSVKIDKELDSLLDKERAVKYGVKLD